MLERLITLTTHTLTKRILQSKYLDERPMTNQAIYRLIKLKILTLMTRFFELNYFQRC